MENNVIYNQIIPENKTKYIKQHIFYLKHPLPKLEKL